VSSGTLLAWVNTDVVTYTSDFSAGVDGWSFSTNATTAGNVDSIGGRDDCLGITVDSTASTGHGTQSTTTGIANNVDFLVTMDVFIPSTNALVDGIVFNGYQDNYPDTQATPTPDTWTTVSGTHSTADFGVLYLKATSSGGTTFDGNGTDVFYIRNVVITQPAADGHVVTWYDQSGNGNDATQTTAANQPKIVDGGVLVLSNGDAAIKSTAGDLMTFSMPSLSADGQQSVFGVFENDVTSQDGYTGIFMLLSTTVDSNGSRNRRPYWFINPNGTTSLTVDALGGYGNTSRERHLYSHTMNDTAGGTSTIHQDGIQVDTRSITLDANANFNQSRLIQAGTNAVGALYMSEVIYYPSDQSANRVAIEANINNHYSPIVEDLFLRA
jgi:hypothetical protein